MVTSIKPKGLEDCKPHQRNFPESWKESMWRRMGGAKGLFVCPGCKQTIINYQEIEADHIIPYSKCGLTVWENMQLLCGRCNNKKMANLTY